MALLMSILSRSQYRLANGKYDNHGGQAMSLTQVIMGRGALIGLLRTLSIN